MVGERASAQSCICPSSTYASKIFPIYTPFCCYCQFTKPERFWTAAITCEYLVPELQLDVWRGKIDKIKQLFRQCIIKTGNSGLLVNTALNENLGNTVRIIRHQAHVWIQIIIFTEADFRKRQVIKGQSLTELYPATNPDACFASISLGVHLGITASIKYIYKFIFTWSSFNVTYAIISQSELQWGLNLYKRINVYPFGLKGSN